MGDGPDKDRLRSLAEEIKDSLYMERLGGQVSTQGPELEKATTAMADFLRECGFLVSIPRNEDQYDRLALPDRVLRVIGDQLRLGRVPSVATIGVPTGISMHDSRRVANGLEEDGLIAFTDMARMQIRLTTTGNARYDDLRKSGVRRVLDRILFRTGSAMWILVAAILGLLARDLYDAITRAVNGH